jgi:hypothetical protein
LLQLYLFFHLKNSVSFLYLKKAKDFYLPSSSNFHSNEHFLFTQNLIPPTVFIIRNLDLYLSTYIILLPLHFHYLKSISFPKKVFYLLQNLNSFSKKIPLSEILALPLKYSLRLHLKNLNYQ